MAWYNEAIFYHIYPLGLVGAPRENDYGEPVHRLKNITENIQHISKLGCNAIYIGPLFESVGHGYETTDYRKLDSRLGTNDDLKEFVDKCHSAGIKVILDGVFNHVGRDFFAFKDLKQNRENSAYKDWFVDVNFYGNNEYGDGFSYANWGGYNLLVKLNQRNPAVIDFLCNVLRFWVSAFDIDGVRLDAADVLDFDFMKCLRRTANEVKPDFWLMGEVIHGDYCRWANEQTLHAVTNYHLHKALFSGHNDRNYFEIAHTVKRLYEMGDLCLYNFVDNHDVERIYSKLSAKEHFVPVHILLYTLPGIPSVYYGSEFAIEGKKAHGDHALRPEIQYSDYIDAYENNKHTKLICALGKIRQETKILSYGAYKELLLTNRQYAFSRTLDGKSVIVAVNNDDKNSEMNIPAPDGKYIGALWGGTYSVCGGKLAIDIPAASGEILIQDGAQNINFLPIEKEEYAAPKTVATTVAEEIFPSGAKESQSPAAPKVDADIKENVRQTDVYKEQPADEQKEIVPNLAQKPYEEMEIEELQAGILAKMAKNGPVTEQMKRDVAVNTHRGSLLTWIRSFNN